MLIKSQNEPSQIIEKSQPMANRLPSIQYSAFGFLSAFGNSDFGFSSPPHPYSLKLAFDGIPVS
jgi:hypothetical protein